MKAYRVIEQRLGTLTLTPDYYRDLPTVYVATREDIDELAFSIVTAIGASWDAIETITSLLALDDEHQL